MEEVCERDLGREIVCERHRKRGRERQYEPRGKMEADEIYEGERETL